MFVYSPSGECLQTFSAYDDQLGVRTLRVSNLGMIAIGSYDEKVRRPVSDLAPTCPRWRLTRVGYPAATQIRLLDPLTWNLCCEFSHAPVISVGNVDVVRSATNRLIHATPRADRSALFYALPTDRLCGGGGARHGPDLSQPNVWRPLPAADGRQMYVATATPKYRRSSNGG